MNSGTSLSTTSSSQALPAATFIPLLDVASLSPFNPKEDLNTLAAHWKLWKCLFNLYLVAKGITKDEQKTAFLLHTGGLNFQELYYTLLTGTDIKPFAKSMVLLDNYFAPQLNVPFERHQFRQMEQMSGESVDQFFCQLKQKAISSSQALPAATFIPLLDVASLSPFNPKEDLNTLAAHWKLWKCLFNLYLVAKGITKDEQKTAFLLHTGGLNFQELYYTLLTGTDIKPFAKSMVLLDNYFAPQLNVPFERHQFRQMEQMSGESVDQFFCQLKQKAISCEFENVDEATRNQLIERCRHHRLRCKFLEKTNATLRGLQDLALV